MSFNPFGSTTTSVPGLDSNTRRDNEIDSDDCFPAGDDDDISLDGLDDADDIQADSSSLGISICIICRKKPPYSKGGRTYTTCGLTCAGILEAAAKATPYQGNTGGHGMPGMPGMLSRGGLHTLGRTPSQASSSSHQLKAKQNSGHQRHSSQGQTSQPHVGTSRMHNAGSVFSNANNPFSRAPTQKCVICQVKPCRDDKFITCGMKCAEALCKPGGSKPNMCDYCHRRPKISGHNQCGDTCRDSAKVACLLCKSRPKLGRYHLCGKSCKEIATKSTPLILEVPVGHTTYDFVENKFKNAWKGGIATLPAIKKIYKVIENKSFLVPYDKYKKSVGNEVFRYHGTRQTCTLGQQGKTQLCAANGCALCSILKTSFKVSLANPSGGFGAGVYSSSAASKARGYSGGVLILTKVVIGKTYDVSTWGAGVKSCPAGYNSVVFDANGAGNETIVYSDDAIRPVFLIFI
ncbi:hypothetical protein B0H34DRAFT_75619 [Crassisporium funariophilum]|nr:hypothetical protein B0H34DRAFT_75619 [Crassisporium funariophilum]